MYNSTPTSIGKFLSPQNFGKFLNEVPPIIMCVCVCAETMHIHTRDCRQITLVTQILFITVAMSTSALILFADFPHAMAESHAEDFQFYVLK